MTQNDKSIPLYSSRIFQIYLEYLAKIHPNANIDVIFNKAGISKAEAADTDHWFTQSQADRFYEAVVAETEDDQIARKAGRFAASAKALNLMKQYILGLMTVEAVYFSAAKLYPMFTRGASVTVKKLGPKKIELSSRPSAGVQEKPYQCENRLGFIEAIPKIFSNDYATVEHFECLHKGDTVCRYRITWSNPRSWKFRLIRNYTLLASVTACIGLSFLIPPTYLAAVAAGLLLLTLVLSLVSVSGKVKELESIVESYHHLTEEQLMKTQKQYDNALLVQEIGQATAVMLNIDDLMRQLADLLKNRLRFDRGLIMLADESGSKLMFSAGYGYAEQELADIQSTVFHLDNHDSRGTFVRCFLDQKPITVNDISEIHAHLSVRSQQLASDLNVHALLCVPIVFEKRSLGILAVDNVQSTPPLKKSDVNLLQGVAAHIAISINNARLFQKLTESEEKYRQTLESMTEGYFETDLSHGVAFMNQALCLMLGKPSPDILGSSFDTYFTRESRQHYLRLADSLIDNGKPVRFAQVDVLHDGDTLLPVDLSVSLKRDAHGKATGFRGILRDATERFHLENEKQFLRDQLIQSQKMEAIGTLAGGIAHDFNNLMMGIQGRTSLMMLSLKPSHPHQEHLNSIESYIQSATSLTGQLLGIARGGKYEPKPIELKELVATSAAMFGRTKKEIQIQVNAPESRVTIEGDQRQIEQVLLNLYVNAWQAMPEGGVLTIRTTVERLDEAFCEPYRTKPGPYARISITDNGIGMDEETCKKIFDPFFTTKEKSRGTGLGLASAYGIVKNHRGIITVSSRLGHGTTFVLFFPLSKGDAAQELARAEEMVRGTGTVLLVDDEEMITDIGRSMLEELGYQVMVANDGEKAVEIISTAGHAIDLVILDLIMPGMDGSKVFNHIRGLQPGIPVLLCSGYTIDGHSEPLLHNGVNGFLQKPFNLSELSQHIHDILHKEKKRFQVVPQDE